MLIAFRVENHRSLRDEQVLTMEAVSLGDPSDPRPRQVDGHAERLLPVAALYGANASGKSNVLAALAFMQDAVLSSHRSWDPEGGVPRDPFAWGEHAAKPSVFEVTLLLDGVRYQYGFVVNDDRFLEEWLYAWPKGRKQTWFEREGEDFTFGEHLKGENKTVQQVTRTNSLFLSTAVQLKHEQLWPIQRAFRFFSSIRRGPTQVVFTRWWLADVLQRSEAAKRQLRPFENDPEVARLLERDVRGSLLELLQAADVGIVDLRVLDDHAHDSHSRSGRSASRILVKHRSADAEAWLPLEEESQGTLGLLHLAPHLLRALQEGQLLIVDELEASLHPLLAFALVQHFNDPAKNPRNAQLIFTTHATNLLGTILGEPPLRRDQVWLTEKNEEGATRIYPLTDYKPRKEENLERGYLQGRYGRNTLPGRASSSSSKRRAVAVTMASKKRDRTRTPGRRSAYLEPRKRILVLTEGKCTEPQYIEGFRRWCRNPLVSVKIAGDREVPLTLVRAAKKPFEAIDPRWCGERPTTLEQGLGAP